MCILLFFRTRSQSPPPPPPPCSPTSDIYNTSCVICGGAYKNTYEKFRMSEDNRANNFLKTFIFVTRFILGHVTSKMCIVYLGLICIVTKIV